MNIENCMKYYKLETYGNLNHKQNIIFDVFRLMNKDVNPHGLYILRKCVLHIQA